LSNPFVNVAGICASGWITVIAAHENFVQALDPTITEMSLYVPNSQMMFLILAKL
jgi:hypothetical protein